MPLKPHEMTALRKALMKLQKAADAGETVGKQTGVDSRSWKQLMELAQGLDSKTAKAGGLAAALGAASVSEESEASPADRAAKKAFSLFTAPELKEGERYILKSYRGDKLISEGPIKSLKSGRRATDKRDNAYGAYLRHEVEVVPAKGSINTKEAAQKILDQIDTPEKALALKGAEREEYLKALDEVYGAREARARDMGFGDKTWYHGTNKDFDAFDNAEKGAFDGGSGSGIGHWFAADKKTAKYYANRAGVQPQMNKLTEEQQKQIEKAAVKYVMSHSSGMPPKSVMSYARKEMASPSPGFLESLGKSAKQFYTTPRPKILEVSLRENPKVVEMKGGTPWIGNSQLANEATEQGKNSVRFNNAVEAISDDGSHLTDTIAIFNPSDIRSVNAAFDPRFKDSPYLLSAAMAAPAPKADDFNAGKQAMDLYDKYIDQPRKKAVSWASEKLSDVLTPKGMPNRKAIKEEAQGTLNFAGDMATDPLNLLGPEGIALGMAMPEKSPEQVEMERKRDYAASRGLLGFDALYEHAKKNAGKGNELP